MATIFELLSTLNDELKQIENAEQKINYDNKQKLSKEYFVNPDLWPEDSEKGVPVSFNYEVKQAKEVVLVEKKIATIEQVNDYSQLVASAVLQMTELSKGGLLTTLNNRKEIKKLFNLLSDDWVPKIIDDRTYQVGRALQKFFLNALEDEEVLGQLPVNVTLVVKTWEIREPARQTLQEFKKILDYRMKIYDLHRPENVAIAIKPLEAIIEWENKVEAFINMTGEIQHDLSTYELGALKEKLGEIQDRTTEFETFNLEWDAKHNDSPITLETSQLIKILADKRRWNKRLLQEWLNLYNIPPSEGEKNIIEIKIQADLKKKFNNGNEYINHARNVAELIQKNILLIEELDRILELEHPIPLPEVIEGNELNIALSLDENPEIALAANKESYEEVIKVLTDYKQQLILKKERIIESYKALLVQHPVPVRSLPKLISAKLSEQTNAIQQQIDSAKHLTHHAKMNLKETKNDLLKLNREKALAKSDKRIKDCSKKLEESPNLDVITQEYQKFLEKYHLEMNYIQTDYIPSEQISGEIKLDSVKLTAINTQISQFNQRQLLLTEAKAALTLYKETIENHKGSFLPITKIPKNDLKQYVAGSDKLNKYIDEIYDNERRSSQFYGFNLTNLSNIVSSVINLDPTTNLNEIAEIIDEKINDINQEFKSFESNQIKKQDLEARLTTLNENKNIALEKEEEMRNLESTKETKESQFNSDKEVHLRAQFEKDLAELVLLSLETEYALMDAKAVNQNFAENFEDLQAQTKETINEREKEYNEQLPKDFKEHFAKMDEQIDDLKHMLAKVVEVAPEFKKEYYPKELNDLDAKKRGMETIYNLMLDENTVFTKNVNDLLEIKEIEAEATNLWPLIAFDLNPIISDAKLREVSFIIETFQSSAKPKMEKFAESPAVQKIYNDTNILLGKLNDAHHQLQIEIQYRKYFGQENGIFVKYKEERAQAFWFKDFIGSFIGFLYPRFQTEAQKREVYLDELQTHFKAFQDSPAQENLTSLMECIAKGETAFSPRTRSTEGEIYDKSLLAKLAMLKADIRSSPFCKPQPDEGLADNADDQEKLLEEVIPEEVKIELNEPEDANQKPDIRGEVDLPRMGMGMD